MVSCVWRRLAAVLVSCVSSALIFPAAAPGRGPVSTIHGVPISVHTIQVSSGRDGNNRDIWVLKVDAGYGSSHDVEAGADPEVHYLQRDVTNLSQLDQELRKGPYVPPTIPASSSAPTQQDMDVEQVPVRRGGGPPGPTFHDAMIPMTIKQFTCGEAENSRGWWYRTTGYAAIFFVTTACAFVLYSSLYMVKYEITCQSDLKKMGILMFSGTGNGGTNHSSRRTSVVVVYVVIPRV